MTIKQQLFCTICYLVQRVSSHISADLHHSINLFAFINDKHELSKCVCLHTLLKIGAAKAFKEVYFKKKDTKNNITVSSFNYEDTRVH